jgi:hypothetical protein
MAHIHKKTIVHAPFADVVPSAINSRPDAWPEWYVGLSAPTRVSGEGEVGTISEHDFLVAGRHFPLTHEVVESTNDGTRPTGRARSRARSRAGTAGPTARSTATPRSRSSTSTPSRRAARQVRRHRVGRADDRPHARAVAREPEDDHGGARRRRLTERPGRPPRRPTRSPTRAGGLNAARPRRAASRRPVGRSSPPTPTARPAPTPPRARGRGRRSTRRPSGSRACPGPRSRSAGPSG